MGDVNDQKFLAYQSSKPYEAIQKIYFKHGTTLHATFLDSTQRVNFNPSLFCQSPMVHSDLNYTYLNGVVPKFDGAYSKWPKFMDGQTSKSIQSETNDCVFI